MSCLPSAHRLDKVIVLTVYRHLYCPNLHQHCLLQLTWVFPSIYLPSLSTNNSQIVLHCCTWYPKFEKNLKGLSYGFLFLTC